MKPPFRSKASDPEPIQVSAPPVNKPGNVGAGEAVTEVFTMPKELTLSETLSLPPKPCPRAERELQHVLHSWEEREEVQFHGTTNPVKVGAPRKFRCEGIPSGVSYMTKHCNDLPHAHNDHLWEQWDEGKFTGWYCDGKPLSKPYSFGEQPKQTRVPEHCGSNDVHSPHNWETDGAALAWCEGVDSDGRGLYTVGLPDGPPWAYLDPYPIEPDAFDPGVLNSYARPPVNGTWDAQGEAVATTPKDNAPLFGFYDEAGRTVVEFRVFNGKVEARYYPSDLDAAAQLLMDHVKKLADG